ncbi:hypothetical protein JCM19237_5319 [Photobacterium aphoticum]|uniref:OmpR/PhoB-type domain-containing protein n=1 Tax=Photobacterium aphoticum TaxID=754436 RepID=A0A090QHN6_9GAMM|nr:hypothetical protein JCM19237_5319 [Photobacterium aphoticum]
MRAFLVYFPPAQGESKSLTHSPTLRMIKSDRDFAGSARIHKRIIFNCLKAIHKVTRMDMMNNPQLRLGRFLWQTDSRSLSTDVGSPSSEALILTQKQFKLLRCLVDASPDVLSHEQIVEKVWQSRPISQESLAQLISRTRNTLCDRDKSILVNVLGEGYKLVFTVVDSAPTLLSETEDSPAIAENSEICTNKTKQSCFTKKVFIGGSALLFASALYQAYAW